MRTYIYFLQLFKCKIKFIYLVCCIHVCECICVYTHPFVHMCMCVFCGTPLELERAMSPLPPCGSQELSQTLGLTARVFTTEPSLDDLILTILTHSFIFNKSSGQV